MKLQQEQKIESTCITEDEKTEERKGQTGRAHIPVTDDGKPTH